MIEHIQKEIEGLRKQVEELPMACEICAIIDIFDFLNKEDFCIRCRPVLELYEELEARIKRLEDIEMQEIERERRSTFTRVGEDR